jgi:integrase/recombinase XerD
MSNSIDHYIDEWMNYLYIERGMSRQTVAAYNLDIIQYTNYMVNVLGISQLQAITQDDIINFISHLTDRNLKPRTIKRKITSIKLFHKFLFLNHYLTENVSSFIEQPKNEQVLPEVFSIEEIDQLIQSFDESDPLTYRDKTMIELMYSAGLRVSEMVNLNLEDIHLSLGFIKCLGKGNKERVVPVGEQALSLLNHYITTIRPKLNKYYDPQSLFLNRYGKRVTRQFVHQVIKKHANQANLSDHLSAHKLRHSFATHLLENKVDIRYIQELLGHSNISTTQVYTHVNSKKLNEVVTDYHPRANNKRK